VKHNYPVVALLLVALTLAAAGCTTATPSSTTEVPTTSSASPTTSVSGTATTTTTTAVTTSGGHAPGSRAAVPPATLGGCSPNTYPGYSTLPLDGSNYYQNNWFTSYVITGVWRDYSQAPFTPSIHLWVIDTVYDINVLKQQMGSKGGFWGMTVDDATNYAAARSSHGYPGWEYRNKATGDAWVGVDFGNGIYLYAYSTPANSITLDLGTLRSFVDGLNPGCWAALAPA